MTHTDRYLKVTVTFERREDGGLRVYSDDVPGFVLSGPNPHAVLDDVVPALTALFEHNKGMNVQFGPIVEVLAELEANGFIPAHGSVEREYVAPIQHAA